MNDDRNVSKSHILTYFCFKMANTKELSKDSAVIKNHKTSKGYKAISKDISIPGKNLHCMGGGYGEPPNEMK